MIFENALALMRNGETVYLSPNYYRINPQNGALMISQFSDLIAERPLLALSWTRINSARWRPVSMLVKPVEEPAHELKEKVDALEKEMAKIKQICLYTQTRALDFLGLSRL